MKKVLKSISFILLALVMLVPTTAFAAEEEVSEWKDITMSDEEIDEFLAPYMVDNSMSRASGLITYYGIAIQKSGTSLKIAGKTNCGPGVTKCGFTEVIIQRRARSTDSWSQYTKYTDLYSNSAGYVLTKTITVPSGYQYRISCTHYAKKILSTEKIPNISNIVTM